MSQMFLLGIITATLWKPFWHRRAELFSSLSSVAINVYQCVFSVCFSFPQAFVGMLRRPQLPSGRVQPLTPTPWTPLLNNVIRAATGTQPTGRSQTVSTASLQLLKPSCLLKEKRSKREKINLKKNPLPQNTKVIDQTNDQFPVIMILAQHL